MSRLNQVMNQTEKAEKKKWKKNKKKDNILPVYDMKGQNITPEKKRRNKRIAILLLTISGIGAVIYFPGMFMKDTVTTTATTTAVETDTTAIRKSNSALRNHPSEDFDGDGLTNSEETTLGTDPWNIDSDNDGASDYYETKVASTDPLSADNTLIDTQTKNDKAKGKSMGSPYKVGNVILWADNYTAKAYGTVVETTSGYHFCNFDGYAQFPSGKYAYRVKNGVRSLLSYREDENAWKISSGDFVEVYDEPLEEIVEFDLFSKAVYANSSTVTDFFATILPSKGFITAQKKMKIDVEPSSDKNVTTTIVKPTFDSNDEYRFTVNNNTLNDLQYVRKSIEEEKTCIAVSLYNSEKGEYLAIIYGYTADGDLLLADMDTLEPIGTLAITESARKLLDENGDIVSISYYGFYGFGFSSSNGDRISFFASSSSESGSNLKKSQYSEDSNSPKSTEEEEETDESSDAIETLKDSSEKSTEDSKESSDTSSEEKTTEETTDESSSDSKNSEDKTGDSAKTDQSQNNTEKNTQNTQNTQDGQNKSE